MKIWQSERYFWIISQDEWVWCYLEVWSGCYYRGDFLGSILRVGYVPAVGPVCKKVRTCNILNIIINATGTFPHTLRLIIQTTDKLQARPSTTTVHLRRAYYLKDLQHLLQPTQIWEGQVTIFCLKAVHVTYVALQSVPENMYHKFIFQEKY